MQLLLCRISTECTLSSPIRTGERRTLTHPPHFLQAILWPQGLDRNLPTTVFTSQNIRKPTAVPDIIHCIPLQLETQRSWERDVPGTHLVQQSHAFAADFWCELEVI
jgi:hypothetical protein